MRLTKKIHQALNLAADKHDGQTRKSSGHPYIVHPFSVAMILLDYVHNEDVIVAGLLHDLLEDVEGYTYENLKETFGEKVADIVKGVSEDKDFNNGETDQETWRKRKDQYLKNLENDSEESLLVCAADKIHNLKSMIQIYEKEGPSMWVDFNAPLEKQIWYYGAILKILKDKLQNDILKELEEEFENFKITVGAEE